MPRSDSWVYRSNRWRDVPSTLRRVIRHRRARARRGFSGYDAWNLDGYLAQVIADGARWLRENSHGYPADLNGIEEWKAVLERIETPLRVWAEQRHDMTLDEEERWEERCREALALFGEYFFALWD